MKLLVIPFFCLLTHYSVAQDTTERPPCLVAKGFCDFKLCDTCTLPSIFDSVTKVKGINYGKYYHDTTYPGDVTYKKEYTPPDGCINTVANYADCTTDSTGALRYDIYYPSSYSKSQMISCPLPVVIFVHGGGYSDCKPLNKNGDDPDGIAWAKRGFIFLLSSTEPVYGLRRMVFREI